MGSYGLGWVNMPTVDSCMRYNPKAEFEHGSVGDRKHVLSE